MRRRDVLRAAPALAGGALLAQNPAVERARNGSAPLKITKVESFVVRTPNATGTPVAAETCATPLAASAAT